MEKDVAQESSSSIPLVTERLLDAEELFAMTLEDVDVYRTKDPILSGLSAARLLIERVDMCFRFMEGSDLLDDTKFGTIKRIRKRLGDIHGNLLDDTLDGFWEDENHSTLEEWLRSTTLVPHRECGTPLIGSGNDSVVLKLMIADRIGQLQMLGPLKFGKRNLWKLLDRIEICDRYLREHDEDSKTLSVVSDSIFQLVNLHDPHEVMVCWETIDFKKWGFTCATEISPVCNSRKIYSAKEIQQARQSFEDHWKKEVSSARKNFFPPFMTKMYPPLPFVQFSKKMSLSCPGSLPDENSEKSSISPSNEPGSENKGLTPNPSNSTSSKPLFPSRKVIDRPLTAQVTTLSLRGQTLLPIPDDPPLPTEDKAMSVQVSLNKSSPESEISPSIAHRRVVEVKSEPEAAASAVVKNEPLLPTPDSIDEKQPKLVATKNSSSPQKSSFVIPTFSTAVQPIRSPLNDASKMINADLKIVITDKSIDRKIKRVKLKLFRCMRWFRTQFDKDISALATCNRPSPSTSLVFLELVVPSELLAKLKCQILGHLTAAFSIFDGKNSVIKSLSLGTVVQNLRNLEFHLKLTTLKFLRELKNFATTSSEANHADHNKKKLLKDFVSYPKKIVRDIKRSLLQLTMWVARFENDQKLICSKFETSRIELFFKNVLCLCCCTSLTAYRAS